MTAKYSYILTCFLVFFLMLFIGMVSHVAYAQTADQQVEQRKAQLEAELKEIEKEIEGQQVLLDGKQNERVSLERDVAILDAKIDKAKLSIRAQDLEIRRISSDITGKKKTIGNLDSKLQREKSSLAQLIRKTNEIDNYSLAEIILGNQNFSDFFEDLDNFDAIKEGLSHSFREIAETKNDTFTQKEALEGRRASEQELRSIQEFEKRKIEVQERERNRILDITKGEEKAYQTLITVSLKSAAEIKAELFTLRGSAPIPFAEAYRYALEATRATGVRPALILGVIAQESNLGENVGQCLLTNDPKKGDGKGVNTGRFFDGIMKPTRDVDPFMAIVTELGINPYGQVVSCPPSYGYGGAMGPAQFIPSTWDLYKKRIGKASGQNPPNPWDPRTAFIASALLMSDNGADKGTYYAERLAALRYFAGWTNAKKPAYGFYGDGVMGLADKYQKLIDVLESS
jgi:peptidoglycan hydrolase CwlO-like protein